MSKSQSDSRKMRRAVKRTVGPTKQQQKVMDSFADAEALGVKKGRQQALDFLHERFLQPDLPPQSAQGKAILAVAKDLAQHLRDLDQTT